MIRLIISSLLLVVISCSSDEVLLPEEVSPDIYKVLLENEDVKVLEVTFDPGQSDNLHDHNPMTIYVLEGGKVQGTLPDGTLNERDIPSGFVGHQLERVRHQIKNIGDNTIKIILVERKKTHSTNYSYNDLILPEQLADILADVLVPHEGVLQRYSSKQLRGILREIDELPEAKAALLVSLNDQLGILKDKILKLERELTIPGDPIISEAAEEFKLNQL